MGTRLTADRLRGIPSLTGQPPPLAADSRPKEPVELFVRWFEDAIAANVVEPLAVTLATVDRDGLPDARTVILKELDDRGWAVAGDRNSAKARQLAERPAAALNFWWQPVMRAVRVRGRVEEASRAESEADLAARSEAARAGIDPADWVLWRVQPSLVEFWQGSPSRGHVRIEYLRVDNGWAVTENGGERAAEQSAG